jgi:hypothetical protein
MRFRTIGTIIFIIGAILIMAVPLPAEKTTTNNTTNITTVQAKTINETGLKTEFDRIAKLPYNEYKCREKSDLLLQYIHQHDPTAPVHTVSIDHKRDNYSHVYVVYQGVVFDPTSEPALYRIPMDKYNEQLDMWGFNRNHLVSTGYY